MRQLLDKNKLSTRDSESALRFISITNDYSINPIEPKYKAFKDYLNAIFEVKKMKMIDKFNFPVQINSKEKAIEYLKSSLKRK